MTGRVGFGTEDLFSGLIDQHSTEEVSLPSEHSQSPRPGEQFAAKPGLLGGSWDVSPDNRFLDIFIGATLFEVAIPVGTYDTAQQLADAIELALVTQIAVGFFCDYIGGGGGFIIGNTASTFEIRWKTGPHGSDNLDDHLGTEIGFLDAADDTGLSLYKADESRFHTHTWIYYDIGSLKFLDPDVLAVILEGDSATDFTDLKAYGFTKAPGLMTRQHWEANAAFIYTFSGRPTLEAAGVGELSSKNVLNPIQIALGSGGAGSFQFFAISWRHFDPSSKHRISMARAYNVLSSSTRTVRELGDHRVVDPTEAIGPDNYYPPQLHPYWNIPLDFTEWTAADWRAVLLALTLSGKAEAVFFALNWSEIEDGTIAIGDVDDEADRGYVAFTSLIEEPDATYSGESSDFISGSLRLIQIV